MKTVGIDMEFFDSNEKTMKVVACVMTFPDFTLKFNLLDTYEMTLCHNAFDYIKSEGFVIVSYAAIAESRAMMSMGIEPLHFQWIDLYVEFIMLCNSNNRFAYGNYISHTTDLAYSIPPNPYQTDEEKEADTADHTEIPKNLINCAYKLLGVRLDAEEKTAMRDLILSKDLYMISSRMDEILEYCESDTRHLRAIHDKIWREYEKEGLTDFHKDQLQRGRYAVATAKCERLGIPINMEMLNKIIKQTPRILDIQKEDVNGFFPFFVGDLQRPPITRKNGSVFHYKLTPAHKDMGAYQRYVESLEIHNFPKTKGGKFKSDKDTLEEWGYWKGLEALWKYNKLESSLKWFNKENGNGFFDRVGSDNCVRPYYGIFGTQTGRNAAKAKTFPLAMSSWLRVLVQPNHGESIIGCDFSQQEVYVAAILSGDENLLDAYRSGDVYLAFAKQAGMVPQNATKSSHKFERMLCKSTVLGLQFGMGHKKLKTKLKLDSGQDVSDEKTQELIDAHKTTFHQYWKWVKEITNEYKEGTPLITNDGWVLFNDNPVITSVRNFPVQANSASITRVAIVRCWEMGLQVMCGLHDAIYVISKEPEIDSIVLEEIMLWATEKILKESKTSMRVDTKVIGHDDLWIEEKGQKDFDKLKEFLL
jgi:DNA polymerase-1